MTDELHLRSSWHSRPGPKGLPRLSQRLLLISFLEHQNGVTLGRRGQVSEHATKGQRVLVTHVSVVTALEHARAREHVPVYGRHVVPPDLSSLAALFSSFSQFMITGSCATRTKR